MDLREWCKKEGRTLAGLAKKTGIPPHVLYNHTAEMYVLKDEYVDKLIEFTGGECTYEDLKRKKKK